MGKSYLLFILIPLSSFFHLHFDQMNGTWPIWSHYLIDPIIQDPIKRSLLYCHWIKAVIVRSLFWQKNFFSKKIILIKIWQHSHIGDLTSPSPTPPPKFPCGGSKSGDKDIYEVDKFGSVNNLHKPWGLVYIYSTNYSKSLLPLPHLQGYSICASRISSVILKNNLI